MSPEYCPHVAGTLSACRRIVCPRVAGICISTARKADSSADEPITADQYRKLCELVMNPDGSKNAAEAARLSDIVKQHGYSRVKDIQQKDFNKIADRMVQLPFDMED
jgi:hypothetical protein